MQPYEPWSSDACSSDPPCGGRLPGPQLITTLNRISGTVCAGSQRPGRSGPDLDSNGAILLVSCARLQTAQELAFFEQVRAAYLDFAAAEPERFAIVGGSRSVEHADAAIQAVVGGRLSI